MCCRVDRMPDKVTIQSQVKAKINQWAMQIDKDINWVSL
jgi:hypothetical protein